MAVTGWKFPSLCLSVSEGAYTGSAWTNPSNVGADDANKTTYSASQAENSQKLQLTGFGFTTSDVPAGSIIDGFEVEVGDYTDTLSSDNTWSYAKLINGNGNEVGTTGGWNAWPRLTDPDATVRTETTGHVGTLWGQDSITTTDIHTTNFGLEFAITVGSTAALEINYVKMRIHYHAASALPQEINSKDDSLDIPWVGRRGPYKTSAGVFVLNNDYNMTGRNTEHTPTFYRSTNPPSTAWIGPLDLAGMDATTAGQDFHIGGVTNGTMDSYQEGEDIYVLLSESVNDNTNRRLFLGKFATATSTWAWTTTILNAVVDHHHQFHRASIIGVDTLASTPYVIVAYDGETDAVMGGQKARVDLAKVRADNGTLVASGVAADDAGDVHYFSPIGGPNPRAAAANKFLLWQQVVTATTEDPPVSSNNGGGLSPRQLTSNNNSTFTLGTLTINSDGGSTPGPPDHANIPTKMLEMNDGSSWYFAYPKGHSDNIVNPSFLRTPVDTNFDAGGFTGNTVDPTGDYVPHGGRQYTFGQTSDLVYDDVDDVLYFVWMVRDWDPAFGGQICWKQSTDFGTSWVEAYPTPPNVMLETGFEGATGSIPTYDTSLSANIITLGSDRYLAVAYSNSFGSRYYHVQVSGSTSKTASGSPSIPNITSTGSAKFEHTASGSPTIGNITSTGSAKFEHTASGSPTIANITSTGVSDAFTVHTASGTPTIQNITSTGVSDAYAIRYASGTPSIENVTSTGSAKLGRKASGSPSIENITSTGVSSAFTTHTASGTPTIEPLTSTGAAKLGRKASGSPTLDAITSTGSAAARKVASGSPTLDALTSTGSATTRKTASGSPTLDTLTSAGTATTRKTASGSPSIENITSTGAATATTVHNASGTPSIENITSTGVATRTTIHNASGTPSIDNITSTGSSKLGRKASGTPSIENITSTGVAARSGNVFSSGTPSIENLTSAGTATTRKTASGSPTIDTLTSTGSATKVRTASGSPTIENITSTGVASAFTVLSASGTPTIENLTSTGSAKFERTASGSPTIENVTSTGVASAFTVISASGTPTIEAITSTGSATIRHEASGSPTIENITSTGSAKFEFTASGSPSIANLTSAGNATRTSVKVTDVNTTESWNDGDTGIVITGTGFV